MQTTAHQLEANMNALVASNRKPQNQLPQTLSINSITSCQLCGLVLDAPVSFVVDIGAGVWLLNGRI